MGIRGTVRRSTDGHIIHANIDTDVIIAEEPPYGRFFLIPDNSEWGFMFALCRLEMLVKKYMIAETDYVASVHPLSNCLFSYVNKILAETAEGDVTAPI